MLMVQLFINILSVRRIYVEECARTVGVAYSIDERELSAALHASVLGRPLPNSAVPHARTPPSSG